MKHLSEVIELLENGWRSSRVLVVGDVMLDKYIIGAVERISPEAPVPVVRVAQQRHAPGGAANVAMNIAALGAHPTLVGIVGDDEESGILEDEMQRIHVRTALTSVPGIPTTSKLRVMSGSHQLLRLDFESAAPYASRYHDAVSDLALQHMDGVGAVILSDYAKGVLSNQVCQRIIAHCNRTDVPVLVDPKGRNFEKYRGATIISPNRLELENAIGHSEPSNIDELLDAGQKLLADLEVQYLAVTLSDKGIAIVSRDRIEIAPAVAKQVFDVSGAGDTVIATLALGIANGLDLTTSVSLANVAAGVVVSKVGTAPIARHELIGALSDDILLNTEVKILPEQQLLARIAEWRALGQKIVLTNGCFDVLHIGHITLLEKAKKEGGRLIVAVNSDCSVRRLKGENRPINSERERCHVLAALASVDAVTIFEEDTPLYLINKLRPDVLVKGGDYIEDTIVGAKEVKQWGGSVKIVPTIEGFSTTSLIQRAKSAAADSDDVPLSSL